MLADSHAHLTQEGLDSVAILQRAKDAGISLIININTTIEALEKGLALSRQFPWVKNAAATHPHDALRGEEDFPLVASYARSGKLEALGETGLDYHYENSPKDLQHKSLRRYIALAQECSLPLIIHCREAFIDLFRIFDEEKYQGRAVLHCFTGTRNEAEEVIARGWFLSLSGIVTFKKSEALREVAKRVPLEQLLLETDAPYLAPMPFRGKPNESAYLIYTAQCIADVRGISINDLESETYKNSERFLGL